MANEQYAFLTKDNLPTRTTWQAAIDNSPFDLQLDPKMNVGIDSGFSPCTICGAELGIEIDYDDSAEFIAQFSEIAPGKDCCVSFRWGGNEIECAIALILSYSLAKEFAAVVSYEGEPPSSVESLLADAHSILEELGMA